MTKSLQRSTMAQVVKMAQNKFVGLTFTKKDGSIRRLNGRFNVHSKTGTAPTVAKLKEYVTIYDVKNGGFRNVNLDTIHSVRTMGIELFI
jgi:hypothetical protein